VFLKCELQPLNFPAGIAGFIFLRKVLTSAISNRTLATVSNGTGDTAKIFSSYSHNFEPSNNIKLFHITVMSVESWSLSSPASIPEVIYCGNFLSHLLQHP